MITTHGTGEGGALTPDEKRGMRVDQAGRRCHACATGGTTLEVYPRPDERRGQAAPGDTIVLCEPCRGVFLAYGQLARTA
jgi:hypothetical protein